MQSTNALQADTVRVWDLPTRLFHWCLVACVGGLFASAWIPSVPVEWHARLGLATLALLIFRLVWGVVGGHWSRFRTFVPSGRAIVSYLSAKPHRSALPGHNPLGALSVLAMLLLLMLQVATGLVADDEIAFTGPLNPFVSTSLGLTATAYHKNLGMRLVVGLVMLHVLAIAYYDVIRKRKLVAAMLHGHQPVTENAPSSRDTGRTRLIALSVLVVSTAMAALLAWIGG